jgi:hypothetical protein
VQVRDRLRIASLLKGRFTDAIGRLRPDRGVGVLLGDALKGLSCIVPLLPTLIRQPNL